MTCVDSTRCGHCPACISELHEGVRAARERVKELEDGLHALLYGDRDLNRYSVFGACNVIRSRNGSILRWRPDGTRREESEHARNANVEDAKAVERVAAALRESALVASALLRPGAPSEPAQQIKREPGGLCTGSDPTTCYASGSCGHHGKAPSEPVASPHILDGSASDVLPTCDHRDMWATHLIGGRRVTLCGHHDCACSTCNAKVESSE